MAGPSPELASALADLPVSPTHYERTGLAPTASTDEIRAAYRAWVAVSAPPAAEATSSTDAPVESALPAPAPAVAPQAGTLDDAAAELRLAYAVLNDPLRRRVYDAYLASHRRVMARAGRWWRRPAFWRRLRIALTLGFMLGAVGAVAWQVWRAYSG